MSQTNLPHQKLSDLLNELYKKDGDKLTKEVEEIITQTKKIVEEGDTNLLWYKEVCMYVVYPDAIKLPKKSSFEALTEHLDYIKELGCNTVHILPFFPSPMIDKGFDISDYYSLREDLGNIDEIRKFTKKANDLKIKVFMDLVLNHISDQHEWFLKAEEGDEKYQNYFSVTRTKPKYIKTVHKNSAVWAVYELEGGEIVEANIAFPESCGPLPHWKEGKSGKIWYYHTYYPQQIDVNWLNPDVFLEFVKIITFWIKLGFNFRLDAIPFVGKEPYKDSTGGSPTTNLITESLYYICNQVKPEVAFLAESYESIATVIKYFGTPGSEQAQLAYNFYLCTALWVSLVTLDNQHIWKQLDKTEEIPVHAIWINFLRNHDELSLAYLSEDINTKVNAELAKRGMPFRGKYGISGRTFSLLDQNKERFLMAYFLLASIPGSMAIPYGDELGLTNVQFEDLPEAEKNDTRNINRGRLTKKAMEENKEIYQALKEILATHQSLSYYMNIWPQKMQVDIIKGEEKNLFLASYKAGSSELIILINLTDKPAVIKLKEEGEFTISASINKIDFNRAKSQVKLGKYGGIWLQR